MSNTKKVPLRKCVGCGEMKTKKEMVRVIKTAENEFFIDKTGKKNGRGAYICSSDDCLEKAFKSRGLERSFKQKVPSDVYEKLREELKENE